MITQFDSRFMVANWIGTWILWGAGVNFFTLSHAGLATLGESGKKTGGVKMATMLGPVPKIESLKPNTTGFVGQTAYLQCIVKHLGDKTV